MVTLNQNHIMDIMVFMEIIDINIMLIDIYIIISMINMIKYKNFYSTFLGILIISSCSLSPGMHMDTNSSWLKDKSYVYIDSLNQSIEIENIASYTESELNYDYKIGKGDQLAITVWGVPDIFPLSNINPDQNLRRVDSNGDIFFPFIGIMRAEGKTQNQLREDLSNNLSKFFKNPQLDLAIVQFNSQRVYLLGEVSKPQKINITDIPLSLSEALGQTNGINNNTAEGSEVFVIRQGKFDKDPKIFIADLDSPSGFITAGNFYLSDNDVVYVNAKGTTRWNRIISQFFPFSTFLNSVDNLTSGD